MVLCKTRGPYLCLSCFLIIRVALVDHKIRQDVKGHPRAKVHLIQTGRLVATITDEAFFTPVVGWSTAVRINRRQTKGDPREGRSHRVRMHADKPGLYIHLQARRRNIVGIQCYCGPRSMSDGKLQPCQNRRALSGPMQSNHEHVKQLKINPHLSSRRERICISSILLINELKCRYNKSGISAPKLVHDSR